MLIESHFFHVDDCSKMHAGFKTTLLLENNPHSADWKIKQCTRATTHASTPLTPFTSTVETGVGSCAERLKFTSAASSSGEPALPPPSVNILINGAVVPGTPHLLQHFSVLLAWRAHIALSIVYHVSSERTSPRPFRHTARKHSHPDARRFDCWLGELSDPHITLDVYGNLHVCKAHISKKNRMKMGLCSTFLWRPTQLLQPDKIYCSRPSQMLKLNLILFFFFKWL